MWNLCMAQIDPRFRHYSIGTRPILKTPSGALCRHCIAPQLLPGVWEAHLRSGIPAARDQQKKLTETCVIAHIENRSLAKKAALLESLGRLGVPLWVNGKPLTHPAVIHPTVIAADGEAVATSAPVELELEGGANKSTEVTKPSVKAQQEQVLHQLNLLSIDPGEGRQGHDQQQFKLCGSVAEQQQKQQHNKQQQQQTPKTSRSSRQQQRRGQLTRMTQQQQAQQQQALCGQLTSTSVCQGQADERLLATRSVATNAASVSHTGGASAIAAVPLGGRRTSSNQQRHLPKERLQMHQQEQLRILSSTSAAEEQMFHLHQQQQHEARGPGNDFLRLAQGVWMDMRPMHQLQPQQQQQQHVQHLHQLQQLQQLHEVEQMRQEELLQQQQRAGPLELASAAAGRGPCAKFPAAGNWRQTQQQQQNPCTESTAPPAGLVCGELQQQRHHAQEVQPQEQQPQQQAQELVYSEAECSLTTVASLPEIKERLPLQQQQLHQLWTPSGFTEAAVHHQVVPCAPTFPVHFGFFVS